VYGNNETIERFLFQWPALNFAAVFCLLFNHSALAQNLPNPADLRSTEGLAYACRENDELFPLCVAYVLGVLDGTINGQVVEAMGRGDTKINPSFCPPSELTYSSIIQLLLIEFDTFPKSKSSPSAVTLSTALTRSFPCEN
jgi:hypothetical protein